MILYILLFIGTMAIGAFASYRVRSTYNKYSQVQASSGLTGAQVAQRILDLNDIRDVSIHATPGHLTDHYDPTHRRLVLSEENYYGSSVAALGVAAHECGHAIQHKVGYSMMTVRQTIAPATQIAAGVSNYVIMAGVLMLTFMRSPLGYNLLMIGAVALAVIVLFQLVTLPVEFDASRRAKKQLVTLGILDKDEMKGANETLDAAALTYVAAFVAALGSLLHVVMMLMGSNRREE